MILAALNLPVIRYHIYTTSDFDRSLHQDFLKQCILIVAQFRSAGPRNCSLNAFAAGQPHGWNPQIEAVTSQNSLFRRFYLNWTTPSPRVEDHVEPSDRSFLTCPKALVIWLPSRILPDSTVRSIETLSDFASWAIPTMIIHSSECPSLYAHHGLFRPVAEVDQRCQVEHSVHNIGTILPQKPLPECDHDRHLAPPPELPDGRLHNKIMTFEYAEVVSQPCTRPWPLQAWRGRYP